MLKRTRSFLVLSLAVAVIAPLLLSTPSSAQAPYKRVYLEEFTGAWCGYCTRGAYAIDNLYKSYPGQVVVVSIHSNQGSPVNDQMDIPQGDSLISDIGFPSAEALQGFPDGWTARTVQGASWNVDPSQWATGVAAQFGVGGSDGLVGQLLATDPVKASVTVDNISFDNTTKQVTARVSVNFAAAASGDLRLNLMVTEDSVSGTGSGWDQHNYYSKTGSVGPSVPNNPMYNYPPSIPNWQHMHVFREAVGGVLGMAGIIPSSVSAGGTYSTTFTFTLPSNVQDPNHVHLIGLVNQYSATAPAGNEVLDADEVPLVGPAPKYFITHIAVSPDNLYSTATSNSSTPVTMNFMNSGSDPVTLKLSIDQSKPLPTGWSASITPASIVVNGGANGTATVNVTAPEQSGFVGVSVLATPVKEGYIVANYSGSANLLSSNTQYALYTAGSYENAVYAGIPDSVRLHTAAMPLTADILSNYDYSKFGAVFLNNIPILDFTADLGLGVVPSVQLISDMLDAGSKVFLNSDDALGYAFDGSDAYFSQYAGYTETPDVQALFQRMGIDWTSTVRRWSGSTNSPFSIKGTSDPVGTGITATDGGGFLSEIFSIDSNSVPVFYSDGITANIIGARYEDPTTHGRLVYLGFGLSEITSQKFADTIAKRSMDWLFSAPSSGVSDQPVASIAGISAAPNPFRRITQVQYVAAHGERNVTLAAYDLLGRKVAMLPVHSSGDNSYTASFDGSKLAEGAYVIVAHSSTGTREVRVLNQQ